MDKAQQAEMAVSFRAMHHGGKLLLLPNAWDAISAGLFVAAGFEAIATTSCGVAWALGCPDGEIAPWEDVVAATARIVRTAAVPVTADIEGGYGATPDEVGLHVAEAIRAGVVGVNLEDGFAGSLRSIGDMAARLGAAREAAAREGVPVVLNARCDVLVQGEGSGDAAIGAVVERCRAYVAAGADCVFPLGLAEPAKVAEVAKAVEAPLNISGRPGMPGLAELRRIGVSRVTIGGAATLAAMASIRSLADRLRGGDFAALAGDFSYREAQALFGKTA